eukprot:gnl/TRDRNA2_/TRDRNA2_188168_c0_seq1.p1 gnl/TRDRNA2_/TRDRNA2_188168_c0~~gnl/TRDRNA2_/TRDRNA2_188168_c0_seq1.p1  ORF type:complete len:245 (-),score=48.97 gnl/TRDRNA2_/TRDRNA2_188168_c0_seq1:90-824(-)
MAYGPLAQCAFMSGPPQFKRRSKLKAEKGPIYDKLPLFQEPKNCEMPPPGQFCLYAFEPHEAKQDPKYAARQLPLDDIKYIVAGSAQDLDGQVYDGHKSVQPQHTAVYFNKGKWFLKAINGTTTVESVTLHPYLKDADGKPPKRFLGTGNRKAVGVEPMDPKRTMTREMCVFKCGDSDRRFWLTGPLPLGEGEQEEAAPGDAGKDRKKKGGDDKRERDRDRDKDKKDRGRSRTRSRSRSGKRRR